MNQEASSPFEFDPKRSRLFLKSLTPAQRTKFNQLKKNDWWWRKIRGNGVAGVDWPVVEEAARNYELMRRFPSGEKFTKTYLELSRDERTVVHGLWVNWSKAPYRFVMDRNQFEEKGWTPIYEHQHKQWNLRLLAGDLIQEFAREIKSLQKMQKIRPQSIHKGEKYFNSWKLIEVLDCKAHGIGPLNSSERHTLSEARSKAKKYFREYEWALKARAKVFDPLEFLVEKPDKDGSD